MAYKMPVACDQSLSLGQDVLFDKAGPHGEIGFSLGTLRVNRTYYISSPQLYIAAILSSCFNES